MARIKFIIACLFLLCPVPYSTKTHAAPASTYVEISDRAYRDIDRLIAFGLARPTIVDQRPFLGSEFARIIKEARENFTARKKELSSPDADENFGSFSKKIARFASIERVLDRLTEKFKDELADVGALPDKNPAVVGHPFENFSLDFIGLKSPPTTIPPENGVGAVSATVNPLLHYREGRHAVYGFQNAFESIHRIRATRYAAFLVHPRFEANMWQTGNTMNGEALLQEGYGVFQFKDVALTMGRKSVVWGPGGNGALLITNNARPMDIIEVATPSPFSIPWIFKYLGEWRLTLFGANLGPEQTPRYPWLTGYRLTLMPVKYVELSFGNTTTMGGEGAPPLSAIDIIGEFLGFRPAGTDPGSPNNSNHIMEAAALVRIPPLWGLELYGTLANEDKRDTLKRFFRDGSSYLAGFHLPRIGNRGISSFRFEFYRMGPIAYRHGIYSKGYTLDNVFIGNDLGSDALGTHARFDCDLSDKFSLGALFDWDFRRSDLHTTTIDPDGTLGDIIVTAGQPAEERFRFVAEPSFMIGRTLKLTTMAGYERVLNASYVSGSTRNNILIAISFKFDIDRHFTFKTSPSFVRRGEGR